MSEAPKRIYLRRVKDAAGSWTKRWQDLWRSDSGDVEYVRSDIAVAENEVLQQKVAAVEKWYNTVFTGCPIEKWWTEIGSELHAAREASGE